MAAALMSVTAAAQDRAPAAETGHSAWDGVYTDVQAARGQVTFGRSCARCHAAPAGAAVRFSGDRFWAKWGEDSLDSLYSYLRRSMPNDAPGTLTDAAYADVVAFLLQSNGLPAGASELSASNVSAIRLAPRDSDGSLPEGALVSVSGCLTKTTTGWAIEHSGSLRRARGSDVAAEAAVAAADLTGGATFQLLYVISPLDKLIGQRVLVRGLLRRTPTPAVNVMAVHPMSTSCAP